MILFGSLAFTGINLCNIPRFRRQFESMSSRTSSSWWYVTIL